MWKPSNISLNACSSTGGSGSRETTFEHGRAVESEQSSSGRLPRFHDPGASAARVIRHRMAASLALDRGTRFLLSHQGRDGLWRDFLTPAGEASEWPTAVIATALHLAGAEPTALERAAETLVANQSVDGGWGYHENVPSDADSTACVLLFLALMGHRGSTCRRAAACLLRHRRTEEGGIATYCDPGPIRRFMGVVIRGVTIG